MSCSNNDTLASRFWKKVNKADGCWEWTGHTSPHGYGMIAVAGGKRSAHRVAYELHRGTIPIGLSVRHTCDNPLCVNPAHLVLGTAQDNVDDRVTRGRSRNLAGEAHALSKLSDSAVRVIRASPLTLGELAAIFGVAKSAICKVRKFQTWKHV